MKTAVVTGITGQDGAISQSSCLEAGYRVFGTFRRTASVNLWRLQELGVEEHPELRLVDYDLTDAGAAVRLLDESQPDEVSNLAAQSFVGVSFRQPVTTAEITGVGAVNLLEAIRIVNPAIRFYQASTSEMFGKVQAVPQDETTPFWPRSPYAAAKVYAHWMTVNYRESYGLFGVSGILFNHESPLRGIEFVTRKITDGLARIETGKADVLELGNLDAKRDWGYAADYVDGMWRMLQCDEPETYVLSTGRTESVRTFVEMSCRALNIDIEWQGKDEHERGLNAATGQEIVRVNPEFYRPAEVEMLIGSAAKAKRDFGWRATTSLENLCAMMVEADLRRVKDNRSF